MNIPCHLNIVEAMDYLCFILVRSSAKYFFPHTNKSFVVVSSEY